MQKTNKAKSITLKQLDKTPIGEIISYPAKELFRLQEEARQNFDKSMMRKKWIEGVIELKYKSTINDMIKNAEECLNSNQGEQDTQKPNKFKDNLFNLHNKHEEFIQDSEDCIKVEFYKGLSDIFQRPTIKSRFSLINRSRSTQSNNQASGV